jgi:hypothetical protein
MISDPPADGTVSSSDSLHLPAPTASPVVLALGITLLFAGLVTSMGVSILGGILCVVGAVGWFRDVLPQEALESVVIQQAAPKIETTRHAVGRLRAEIPEVTRAWLPLEIYPVSAGIKGGLAGSVPMAVLAMLYGLIAQRSVWYPINLLVAGFFPGAVHETTAQLAQFHAMALIIAIPLHLITSVMVGLLYGALLPMFPRRPILLGGSVRAHRVVGFTLRHFRHHQSCPESADQLVLVCFIATRVRARGRDCCLAPGTNPYLAGPAF